MKKLLITVGLFLCTGLLWGSVRGESGDGVKAVFPDLAGFAKQGNPRHFDRESLFEHIDGKAGSYLDFGFEELATQTYTSDGGARITVDIYRHRDPNNGFGIYSSERPHDVPALSIGGGGYRKKDAVNFFKGAHYVKLLGEDLGGSAESVLVNLAGAIAESIEGDASLPPIALCFPEEGMVQSSIQYVARGFLGHGFLHSAFVADYRTGPDAEAFRVFVIEAADEDEAGHMLESYLDLVRNKGGSPSLDDGTHRFHDPYRVPEGVLNVRKHGTYLIGLFHDEPAVADRHLDAIRKNLQDRTE
jgi:hypothetical protein